MFKTILEFISKNWFAIAIAIAVVFYVVEELVQRNKEEKIAIAKHLIAVSMDVMVAEAEFKFADYEKAGNLKRSYVIQTIYEKYPELNIAIGQEELLIWIDNLIENSVARLKTTISEIDRK